MTRDQAIAKVLVILRNPLMLMSVPDREDALALAREHNITAEDLLRSALHRARQA